MMSINLKLLVAIAVSILSVISVAEAQQDWKFRKEKDGIKAYTRPVKGSSFDEFKVMMTIPATKEAVLEKIKDYTIYEKLYTDARDVRNIRNDEDVFINYARAKTPIVAKDREAVYHNVVSRHGNLIKIAVSCVSDHYTPNKKYVQITKCDGTWELEDMGDGMVRVQQQVAMDPGGSIPAWVANRYVVNNPIESFQVLKRMVTK